MQHKGAEPLGYLVWYWGGVQGVEGRGGERWLETLTSSLSGQHSSLGLSFPMGQLQALTDGLHQLLSNQPSSKRTGRE